ncbi:MAG: FtsX-like permease family protein [Candidatus Hydrogenedentota bacterium]
MGVLNRKLYRTMLRNWGQALAVTTVMLCGVAMYISMGSAFENLRVTQESYYAEYRFSDFFVSAERVSLTAVRRLETIPGVREVRGRVVQDVNLTMEDSDQPRTGRLISMPDRRDPVLNDVHLVRGRYFDEGSPNQTILSKQFAEANDIEVGDTVSVLVENRRHNIHVVGVGMSPEYVYMIPGLQSLYPIPERFGVLWVPESFTDMAMDMRGASNDIVGTVDEPRELGRILDRIDAMLDGYGVHAMTKAEDQMSNMIVSQEIKQLRVMARVIPTLFMGIASAILLVLLNRMVRQERTEIGLLKAFGYSNWTVSGYYVRYALLLAAAGCAGGVAVGQWLARGLGEVYVEFFQFPDLVMQLHPNLLISAILISAVAALLGAVSAARQAAAIHPAEAMRPEAPRHGRRMWLERFAGLWRSLSFTWKMIIRNVGRNQFRAAINIGGVMMATGLLLIGLVFIDSVYHMVDFQFREVQREDMRITFATELPESALREMARFEGVRKAEPMLQYPFQLRSGWRTHDTAIQGFVPDGQLRRLLDVEGQPVRIEGKGVILSEALARELQVSAGDTIEIEPLMGRVTRKHDVVVRRVVQEYLGMSAYMGLETLSRLLETPYAMNAVLLRVEEGAAPRLSRAMNDVPAMATVEDAEQNRADFEETMAENIVFTSTFLVGFAGVIAFSIIYNSTIVSLLERQRELASLRVLGFTKQEVGAIMYQENFLLGGIGILLGIPFGVFLGQSFLRTLDTELYRIPYYAETSSFVFTAVLIAGFIVLANLAVRRRIQRLDMVEVLKSRE